MGAAQHLLQTNVTDVAQGQAHPMQTAELVNEMQQLDDFLPIARPSSTDGQFT